MPKAVCLKLRLPVSQISSLGRRCTVTGSKSKKEELTFEIPDFDALQKPKDAQGVGAKRLEVRIYNADGVPAERIQIPFRATSWHIDD